MKANFYLKLTCILCCLLLADLDLSAQNIFPDSGNAGIGTVTPTFPLHIRTSAVRGLQIDGTDPNWAGMYANALSATGKPYYAYYNAAGRFAWHYMKPTGEWALHLNGTDRLTVNSNGLGVGTTNPGYRLHVASGSTKVFQIDASRAGLTGMVINATNAVGIPSYGYATNGKEARTFLTPEGNWNVYNGGAERLTVSGIGNVGIGTTTPLYPLHINAGYRAVQVDGNDPNWTGMYINNTTATGQPFYGYQNGNGNWVWHYIKTNGDWALSVGGDRLVVTNAQGNVLINKSTQTNTIYKLDVNGSVRANELVVNTSGADFVFEDKYKLRSLDEVESFIKANKHLPEVPSAKVMSEEGMKVAELNTTLLQKVEELTLYLIEMKKENESLKERLNAVETELKK